jgi:hypothetical protein
MTREPLFICLKNLFKKISSALPSFIKMFLKNTKEYKLRKIKTLYKNAYPTNSSSGKVLFWVPGGMPLMLHVEGAIAAALKLRGIDVHAVICGGSIRACVRRVITEDRSVDQWSAACPNCRAQTSAVIESLGIPYSFIGNFVPESEKVQLWKQTNSVKWDNLDQLCYRELNVGSNARSAIIRYLQGYELNGNEELVREYAYSALACAAAADVAIKRLSPTHIFMSHGIYVDWGPALHTALVKGIPITAWMASYLKARFYFRHVEDRIRIDLHNMNDKTWKKYEQAEFTASQSQHLDHFLANRYREQASFDMQKLPAYTGDKNRLRNKYAHFSDKPIWGIISHINWDCVSDYSPMAYATFDDWMIETINEISGIQDVNWLIKIHPAESWDNPASGAQNLINRHFPDLPSHLKIIAADENISPLEFFQQIDGGVTVYGTSGLELALMGKPVILAGEAHYGAKGFTYDGLTPAAYRKLLHQASSLNQLSEEQHQLARKYAYCYFIQRQVPLPIVKDSHPGWWSLQYDQLHKLLPGQDEFVDFICDKLLARDEFIMDDDLAARAKHHT